MSYRELNVWAVRTSNGEEFQRRTVVARQLDDALRRAAATVWGARMTRVEIEFLRALAGVERLTKWDLIDEITRGQLDRTPFDDGVRRCSGCGEPLPTEGAFARHFTVTDYRYRNLGECPGKS